MIRLGKYFSDKFPDVKITKADKDNLARAAENYRTALWRAHQEELNKPSPPIPHVVIN